MPSKINNKTTKSKTTKSKTKPTAKKKKVAKIRQKTLKKEDNKKSINEASKKSSTELIKEYISTLSELELKTMEIATNHLKTSFNIEKSIGYKKWLGNR
jgi:CHAT domain-containing protein